MNREQAVEATTDYLVSYFLTQVPYVGDEARKRAREHAEQIVNLLHIGQPEPEVKSQIDRVWQEYRMFTERLEAAAKEVVRRFPLDHPENRKRPKQVAALEALHAALRCPTS